MRHVVVMTATASLGLLAIFLVDFFSLLYVSWLGDPLLTAAVGYASSSEALVRFGLGSNKVVDKIEIRWPGGGAQSFARVTADRILEVVEP